METILARKTHLYPGGTMDQSGIFELINAIFWPHHRNAHEHALLLLIIVKLNIRHPGWVSKTVRKSGYDGKSLCLWGTTWKRSIQNTYTNKNICICWSRNKLYCVKVQSCATQWQSSYTSVVPLDYNENKRFLSHSDIIAIVML